MYFIPSFQSSPPYFFLLFFKLLMLSSTEQWCHHYFIRPAQAAASGLWSMCELGRASILRVLASGPPPISVSQHICQVLLVLFLGLPMEVCRGLWAVPSPGGVAGRVTASVRMPPCCRNPFVLLCSWSQKVTRVLIQCLCWSLWEKWDKTRRN